MGDQEYPRVFLLKLGGKTASGNTNHVGLGMLENGTYLIEWDNSGMIDRWYVLGVETKQPLSKQECERVIGVWSYDRKRAKP